MWSLVREVYIHNRLGSVENFVVALCYKFDFSKLDVTEATSTAGSVLTKVISFNINQAPSEVNSSKSMLHPHAGQGYKPSHYKTPPSSPSLRRRTLDQVNFSVF